MSDDQLRALLGRPLTANETANKQLYLDIAKEQLESKPFCIQVTCGPQEEETRIYGSREGYSTIFTDIFTEIIEVKVNDTVVTNFHPAFWDNRNSSFYNSIVFEDRFSEEDEVSVTATWGFEKLPNDLKRLWAKTFATVSAKTNTKDVKSKKVEDFSITYGELSDNEVFMRDNATTIQKYSLCNIGYVRHGSTCATHGRYNCGHCL